MLLIEHDIDRVLALSDRITVLHQGRVIADGKPADVANNPEVITAYLGAERTSRRARRPTARDRVRTRRRQADPGSCDRLRAGYAGSVVLDGLSIWSCTKGEAVALLGRNGVGKTTTLRAITGTVREKRRPHHHRRHRHHQRASPMRSTGWAFRWSRRAAGCSPT